MKCPHCHQEIEEGLDQCPLCGEELEEIDDPQLNIVTKIFIVVGLVVLVSCGVLYYAIHKNDPEYVRTQIDPDSALADQFDVKFDTIPVKEAAANDSTKESEQAAKVFSSIRGKQTDVEEKVEEPDVEDVEASTENVVPHVETPDPSAVTPSEPTPKVESLE